MHSSDSIVIIPTYNEKENIEKIIRAIFALPKCFHILVIDDGSPDGTAGIVKVLMANEFGDRLFIHERSGKLGLGTAYIEGFKWALAHDYEYIFEMDADFSHDPNDLPRLYAACHDEGYDVAIGSRYVSGVNVVNWPIGRVLMSYFASKYVKCVTGFKVHDTTAGFVCYKRRVLKTIELDKIRFKGYGFQIEMKYTAHKIGIRTYIRTVNILYKIYQIFIAFPVMIIMTIITALEVGIGTTIGDGHFWGYYPGRWWAKVIMKAFLLPMKVEGQEHLESDQSYVFVANHQGIFDIFVIYGYLGRNFKWMMKYQLGKIPFVGYACRKSHQIFVDKRLVYGAHG